MLIPKREFLAMPHVLLLFSRGVFAGQLRPAASVPEAIQAAPDTTGLSGGVRVGARALTSGSSSG